MMFDGQFGPNFDLNSKANNYYYAVGKKKRNLKNKHKIKEMYDLNADGCMGESDIGEEIFYEGEDHGEDGYSPLNKYMVKKNIRNLHKYRERIQVLNEDLNVLIFDGEEDIDL
jgi:hypothetical protein